MSYEIPQLDFPDEVAISDELAPEERPRTAGKNYLPHTENKASGPGFHEKLDKNKKVNLGGSYKRKLAEKYKKPLTRGDKNQNRGNKKR